MRMGDAGKLAEHEYQALRVHVFDEWRTGLQESGLGPDL